MAPLIVGTSGAPPSTPSNPELADRLAKARALRDAAIAIPVPTYAGDGSKASRLRFVQTKVKDWYERSRDATERATQSYRDAYDAAATGPDRAVAASEAADVQATFCKRFLDASNQGEPDEWKTQADLHDTYHQSLLAALTPYVTKTSATIDKCLADPAVDSPATRRCTTLRAELASLTPSPAPAPPSSPPPPAAAAAQPAASCTCVAGDPLCTCAQQRSTKPPPPPRKNACTCKPADPLCSCL
jgi:hypothetical protein